MCACAEFLVTKTRCHMTTTVLWPVLQLIQRLLTVAIEWYSSPSSDIWIVVEIGANKVGRSRVATNCPFRVNPSWESQVVLDNALISSNGFRFAQQGTEPTLVSSGATANDYRVFGHRNTRTTEKLRKGWLDKAAEEFKLRLSNLVHGRQTIWSNTSLVFTISITQL